MIRKLTACFICLAMIVACIPTSVFAETAVAANTYIIKTEDDLNSIRQDLDGHYVLSNDIEITSESWDPIGSGPTEPFTGTIDGNGHVIRGLNVVADTENADYLGFVGYNGGQICDLVFEDGKLESTLGGLDTCHQGLICGFNGAGASINNCDVLDVTVEHFSNSGELFAGAAAGYNEGTITETGCTGTFTGEHIIHAKTNVGGITGRNESSALIENCYTAISIDSFQNITKMKMSYWGGICGYNAGTVRQAFCTGNLKVVSDMKSSGKSYLGGITGQQEDTARIAQTYQYADITGAYTKKGNIFGMGSSALVQTSFYVDSNNLVCNGGTPLNTVQMYMPVCYIGYDFDNVWFMGEGNYGFPQLRANPFKGQFEKVSLANAEIAAIEPVTYNGSAREPEPEVTFEGRRLIKDFDYTVEYRDNIDAGTAAAVICGIGRFYGEETVEFVIDPADISGRTVTLDKEEYVCTGKAIKPVVTVSGLVQDRDYTVAYSGNVVPGTGKITVTGCGNYTGVIETAFTITDPQVPSMTKVTGSLYNKYNTVRVSWTKVSGVTGYKVMYKKASAVSWNVKRVTSNYATLPNLAAGAKYTVKVFPYVKAGNKFYEGKSSSATVYTLKKLNKPSVKKAASGKVKVSWNNINGETGYQISRALKPAATNVIATVKTTTGKSKVVKAPKGKTYYYKVRAYKTVNGKKIFAPWSKTQKFKNK